MQKIQLYLGYFIAIFSFILLIQSLLVMNNILSMPSNLGFYNYYENQTLQDDEFFEFVISTVNVSNSQFTVLQRVFESMMMYNQYQQSSASSYYMMNSMYTYIYFLIIVLILGLFMILNALQQHSYSSKKSVVNSKNK